MKKSLCLLFSVGCLILLLPRYCGAQAGAADTGNLLQAGIANAKAVFNKSIGAQSPLYNGSEYHYIKATKGSPYFMENTHASGDVIYDGLTYKNIPLILDVYRDELVTALEDNLTYFSLLKDRVQNFDLLGHHFISITTDSAADPGIKSGYYEEVYHGRTEVVVKFATSIEEKVSSTGTPEAFSTFTPQTETFFVRNANAYYKVSSEGDLLDVLKDHKKLLQKYIKTQKIKYRNDARQALASVAAYYDRLSN